MKWLLLLSVILQFSNYALAVEDGHFSVDIPKYCTTIKAKKDNACFRDRRDDEFHNELEIVDDALVRKSGDRGSILNKYVHIEVTGFSENPDHKPVTLLDTPEMFRRENEYYGLYGLVGKVRVQISISGYETVYADLNLQQSGDIYTIHMLQEAHLWSSIGAKPQQARMDVRRAPHNGALY